MTRPTLKPFACEEGRVSYELQSGTESPGLIFTLTLTFENIFLQSWYTGLCMHMSQLGEDTICFKQTPVTLILPGSSSHWRKRINVINLVAYMNILQLN